MTLYVIPVPQPAAGTDWQYAVPGQYIEHITSITATLNPAGTDPTLAIDSGFPGYNLTYAAGNVDFGIPGYVSTDEMVQYTASGVGYIASGPTDTSMFTFNDIFFVVWTDAHIAVGNGPAMVSLVGSTVSSVVFELLPGGAGQLQMQLRWVNTDFTFGGAASPAGIPFGPHMYGCRYDLALDKVQFYLDGNPWGGLIANGGAKPLTDDAGTAFIGGQPQANTFPHYDEIAWGSFAVVDADFANLYSLRNNFAAYTTAQMDFGARSYYHLDELSSGPQRQVTLNITDGTHRVLEVPTGFTESPNPGTFEYSWQPNLNSSTQTADKLLTTVAIPDLILPAGYTIGTRTLDLDVDDQWADVFIWWNSDIMDALNFLDTYVYPPGVRLVYQKQAV